ncbi:uncharacterized protein LOC133812635 [Humulus lupulus]|uniref:uncharacterized protein LOC133812635 n=1 Tax=Humulus lupulus TaxID=3486 RepID=UPI002B404EFA|nr:uncharacterized protein LOC133812635 [Humulus lupulus]XP_062102406.1 uncharacterized protein LOC133812635 [Humulus lupulus]
MAKTRALLVVFCAVALCAGPRWGSAENAADEARERVKNQLAEEATGNSLGSSQKLPCYVGTEKSENKVINNAWEEPSMATDAVKSASPDKSKNGEAAGWTYDDAKQTMLEALEFGIERASDAYERTKKFIIDLVTNNEVLDKAYDVEEDDDDDQTHKKGKEKARVNYNEAKENEKASYRLAKEKMTEEEKARNEAAKENVSQAAGDLGEVLRLREKREEL